MIIYLLATNIVTKLTLMGFASLFIFLSCLFVILVCSAIWCSWCSFQKLDYNSFWLGVNWLAIVVSFLSFLFLVWSLLKIMLKT